MPSGNDIKHLKIRLVLLPLDIQELDGDDFFQAAVPIRAGMEQG
jgi:hypothetical protein